MTSFMIVTSGKKQRKDFTWLKRPWHGSAFPKGPFDSSYSRRITIVLSRVIKAGIGQFGVCRDISTGQAWPWGNPLRSVWSHVNHAREVNRGSWKSVCCNSWAPLGKYIEWTLLWDYRGQIATTTLFSPLLIDFQNTFIWFQQHHPLMLRVLQGCTLIMFSHLTVCAKQLHRIEIRALRQLSSRKCSLSWVWSCSSAQPTILCYQCNRQHLFIRE